MLIYKAIPLEYTESSVLVSVITMLVWTQRVFC